jgi:SAM-dependent methyltransferase
MESQHRHHRHESESDPADLAELLDLDAEVLHGYLAEVLGWVQELAGPGPHDRLLDLGAGTGTGTLALAQRYPGAAITALDMSGYLLDRLRAKARDLGLADRVRAVEADLDAAWPDLDPVDLAWASSSLHHMADADQVLTTVFAALRPGGRLVVAELDSFPLFLPDDAGAGRPGLEARCHAVLAKARAEELPALGSGWGARIARAGFTVEAERHFPIHLTPPLPDATARYARASLRRLRSGLDDQVDVEDLAALDALIDGDGPESILRRDDLTVRAARTVWVARRP